MALDEPTAFRDPDEEVLALADEARAAIERAADALSEMTGKLRNHLDRVRAGDDELDDALVGQLEVIHQHLAGLEADHDPIESD